MRRLSDRFDRLVNPILVKEMYQGMRRRELGVGGAIALFVPVVVYLFALSDSSDASEYVNSGQAYAGIVTMLVAMMAWFVIPIGSAQQLHGELKSQTLELLALTRLSSWELVSGRFLASLVKLCLVLSFAGPFAVVAILMGGSNLEEVATLMATALAGCCIMSSLALLAVTPTITAPGFGRLVLVGCAMFVMSGMSLFGSLLAFGGSSSPLASAAWLAATTLSSTLFFLRLTADVFAPPGRRSYALSKLTLIAALATICAPLWAGELLIPAGPDPRRIVILVVTGVLMYTFVTMWGASRPLESGSDARWPLPLRNGYEATLAYAALLTLGLCGLCVLNGLPWRPAALCLGYYTFFTGLGTLLHGALPDAKRTVESYLAMLLSLGMLNSLATALLVAQEPPALGPAVLAFLPLRLLTDEKLIEHPQWSYLGPTVVGVVAILLARMQNARTARRG